MRPSDSPLPRRAALRSALAIALVASHLPAPLAAQGTRPAPARAARTPASSPLCDDEGTLQFTARGQAAGEERYTVRCRPDGSVDAVGSSRLELAGMRVQTQTTVDLGPAPRYAPRRLAVTGTVGTSPIDQTVVFGDTSATVTNGGKATTLPAARDASFLGSNVFFTIPFFLARYDTAAGGTQAIVAFPSQRIPVTRLGRDAVRPRGGDGLDVESLTRWSLGAGAGRVVLWTDARGRVVGLTVPMQGFTGVREGFADYLPGMLDALARDSVAANAPPDYSAPAGAAYTAEEVVIPVRGYRLAGTLLLPKARSGPLPVVVTITGSGLQTRDEPIEMIAGYRPFRQIAESLATRGIAVLRVDDRGVGGSTGMETLAAVTTSDLTTDTQEQVRWLRARPEIDPLRIFLLGHSEGASIAVLAASMDRQIAGVITMAGPSASGAEISVEQVGEMAGAPGTKARAEAEARQRAAVQRLLEGGQAASAGSAWTREYMRYDPLPTARRLTRPLLVLQGANDRQVLPTHAERLARAVREGGNKDVTVRVFPGLNHLFLRSTTGQVDEYPTLKQSRLDPVVVGAIVEWVRARSAR